MILLPGTNRAGARGYAVGLCCLLTAVGCENPAVPRVVTMSAISPTTRDAVAGQAIHPAPGVVVRDAEGRPVAGIRVTFSDPSLSPAVVKTGADGEAAVDWYANPHVGLDRMTVSADGLASVVFVADVHAGPATQLESDIDLDQVGLADETLPGQPSVRVVDNYGNPVTGIGVTFTVGGAAASTIQHATAVSDSNGHAMAGGWTLGSAVGVYTLTAAATDVPATLVFRAQVHSPFAASAMAAGGYSTCAIASTGGGTYCWGAFGNSQGVTIPDRVASAPPLVALAVGYDHACGLTNSGAAYCWGENSSGQLGLGNWSESELPSAVVGDLSFATLVVGNAFTCGLTTDKQTYCWGDNSMGQLGIAAAGNRSTPTAVAAGEPIATLAAGFSHACATAASGTTYCWGADDRGQLGQPAGEVCHVRGGYYDPPIDVSCSTKPLPLANAPGAFTALAASAGTCGLLVTGEAYCWGFSRSTISPDGRFVSLAPGGANNVCGITTTQSIACWYYPDATAPPSGLTAVPGIADPTGLVGGYTHWCAIAGATKTAYCWGENFVGQLGNGTLVATALPRPVASP